MVWQGGGGQGGTAMGVVVVGIYWGAVGKIKIAEGYIYFGILPDFSFPQTGPSAFSERMSVH